MQFSERLQQERESWEATTAAEMDVQRRSHAKELEAKKRSRNAEVERLQVKKCRFGFLRKECFC